MSFLRTTVWLLVSGAMLASICFSNSSSAAVDAALQEPKQKADWSEPAVAELVQRYGTLETFAQRANALPELRDLSRQAIAELGPDSQIALRILYVLVVLETNLLELDSAIRNGEECLARRKALLGETHDETIEITAQLGVTYAEAGQNGRAKELLETALGRAEARKKPADELLLGIVDDYGALLSRLSDPHGALRLGYRAFEGWTELTGASNTWTIFSAANLVHALTRAGRLAEAIAVARKAIGALVDNGRGKPSAALVRLYHNFAAVLYVAELREESLIYFGLASRSAEAVWGPNHYFTMQFRAMGIAHGVFGLGASQLTQLHELAADCDSKLGQRHSGCGSVRLHLAKMLIDFGQPEVAVERLQDLVDLRLQTEPPGGFPLIQARQALALALARAGRREQSLEVVDRVIEHTDRLRLMFGTSGPDRQGALLAHLPSYQLRLSNLIHLKQHQTALVASESIKAQRLSERLGLRALLEAQDVSTEQRAFLAQKLEAVAEADRKLSTAIRKGANLVELDGVRAERVKSMDGVLDALSAGRSASRAWANAQTQTWKQVEQSAKALAAGELFVSYHWLPGDSVLATMADGAGRFASHELGRISGLGQMVTALRLSAASPAGARFATDATGSALDVLRWTTRAGEPAWGVAPRGLKVCTETQTSDSVGATMAKQTVDPWWPGATSRSQFEDLPCRPIGAVSVSPQVAWPAISHLLSTRLLSLPVLSGKYSRLIISPDGPLWALPWELLLRASPRKHLSVTLVHSLGHLAHVRERRSFVTGSGAAGRLLAVGDPAYPVATNEGSRTRSRLLRTGRLAPRGLLPRDGVQRPHWPRLPYSRQEVQRIAAGFAANQAQVLTGGEASEEALRRMASDGSLASYSHLVFSVHGYFDSDLPDGAGIVLTATGDSPESDGYVTVNDMATWALRSRLTLLSACNSARGERDFIEGHTGLSYALSWAGSDATVAALWPVSDRGAAAFSVRLLNKVRLGVAPARALAEVKREFQASADPTLNTPSVWAAFVLHGD